MTYRLILSILVLVGAVVAQPQCLPANTAATGNVQALTITSNTGNTLPGSIITIQSTGAIPGTTVDFMFTNCPAPFCPFSQPVPGFGTILFDPFPFVPGVPNLFTDFTTVRVTADAMGNATIVAQLTMNPGQFDILRWQSCSMSATGGPQLSNECFFIIDF